MISLISKNIVHFFINQKAIKEEDEEVYRYGSELIISTTLSAVSTLLIALLLGKFFYFVLFYLFFIPLRSNAGGYHADSYEKCFVTTNSVFLIYTVLLNIITANVAIYISIVGLLFNFIIIWKFAPLIHGNNVVNDQVIRSRKILSRVLISIYSVIITILLWLHIDYILISAISLAVSAVTISMIIQILYDRRCKQ